MNNHSITLKINGEEHKMTVPANRLLLDVLRDDLQMTETKYGCGTGECGACTVLVEDNKNICSCVTLAATMDGREITTVAGLEKDGELHPVQEAFIDEFAVQCGYCIPGMVLKTVSMLSENPQPTEEEIRRGLEGNMCRCTGYTKIVNAVQKASAMMAGSES